MAVIVEGIPGVSEITGGQTAGPIANAVMQAALAPMAQAEAQQEAQAGGTVRAGLSLSWVAGLGLALHPSYRLLMGLPILALFALRLYRGARWPLLAPAMTTLSTIGMYLYLPIRSASGNIAALDWGHASTLGTPSPSRPGMKSIRGPKKFSGRTMVNGRPFSLCCPTMYRSISCLADAYDQR